MIQRISALLNSRSFFLFGPRGTGKSTLLEQWSQKLNVELYDLLDLTTEALLNKSPEFILEKWNAKRTDWIIIDEIQKNPILLDIVQKGISKYKIKFALTGSSARKLRSVSANLLGGRDSEFHLNPFTHIELKNKFNLIEVLKWGTLPVTHP